MKLKLKLSIVLLACLAFTYTACKKSNSNPTTTDPVLTPTQVSSQVALNIAQTFYGGYGYDATGGISGATDFAVKHSKGKKLNDITDGCSFSVDSTVNYTATKGDTTAKVSGSFGFAFICTNNVLTGFSDNYNLNIGLTSPQFTIAATLVENLTIVSLDPNNENADISLKGSLSTSSNYNYKTGTKKSGAAAFSYTQLTTLLDPNTGEILSGSASFTTKGSGATGSWDYAGTIKFLGSHKVVITINGKTYNVDITTGVVS
jgi:hypothetical protein